jgi:hypothetical protein
MIDTLFLRPSLHFNHLSSLSMHILHILQPPIGFFEFNSTEQHTELMGNTKVGPYLTSEATIILLNQSLLHGITISMNIEHSDKELQ